jgi:hypothetical protein
MTPAQLAAFNAICKADPECRCPLVYRERDVWMHRFTPHLVSPVPNGPAAAAITDHLHTRLCVVDEDRMVSVRSDGSWRERRTLNTRFTSKLSAYLAAHIVRLGLDRTLIENMEGA